MKPIYLSQVNISNFRSFGANSIIDIPAKPGLFIVYGMNGLGKTTFFEALEWILTGDVRRIGGEVRKGQLDNFLARHGAKALSHRVTVNFGDASLTRTATSAPTTKEIVDLLCREDWSPLPSDTSPYFRLTMFLPQSKRYRFDVEKPSEQWKLLEGPAGVDRLNRMREALGSRKAINAFRREIEKVQSEVEKSEKRLQAWIELLRSKSTRSDKNASERFIAPDDAMVMIDEILLSAKAFATKIVERPFETGTKADDQIASIQRQVDRVVDNLEERKKTLEGSSQLVAEWIEIQDHSAKLSSERELCQVSLSDIDLEIRQNADSIQSLELTANTLKQKILEIEQAIARLTRLVDSRQFVANAIKRIAELKVELSDCASLRRKSIALQNSAQEQLRLRKQLVSELRDLTELEKSIVDLQMRAKQHFATQSQATIDERKLNEILQEQSKLVIAKPVAETTVLKCKKELESLEKQKATALQDAARLAKALSKICEHITADATECPICQAKYEVGELYRLGQESLSKSGVATPSLDSQILKELESLNVAETELTEISARIEQIPVDISALSEVRDERKRRWKNIEDTAIELNLDRLNLLDSLESKLDGIRSRFKIATSELTNLPPQFTADELLESATNSVREVEAKAAQVESQIQNQEEMLEGKLAEIRLIEQATPEWSDLDSVGLLKLIDDQKENRAVTNLGIRSNSEELESKSQIGIELKAKRSVIDSAIKKVQLETTEKDERQRVLLERWNRLELSGQPNSAILASSLGQSEDTLAALSSIRRKAQQIAAGLSLWAADEKARMISSQVDEIKLQMGLTSESEITGAFTQQVQESTSRLSRVQEAAARAEQLAKGLQDRADEFNDRALKPLASRIQQYHDVLSPFRYRIGITATGGSSAPALRQTVMREGPNQPSRESPTLAELSDGQMSVQGLSTLFSASTEYRWSRWPALLLDDPLQSSDVLHAAAFLDILRGLILNLGYQIFISSHDLEEAKYIIRKCERSGILVTQCHLVGPGVNGVRYSMSKTT